MLQHVPHRTFEAYARLGEDMTLAHASASLDYGKCTFPKVYEDFRKIILDAHRRIFAPAQVPFAGRFRVDGEEVSIGNHTHQITGSRPSEIEATLRNVFNRVDQACLIERRLEEVAMEVSKFLERFFRVHPFFDGNGRVARIVWMMMCRPRFSVIEGASTGRLRRKYIKALEYAHKHAPESDHHERGGRIVVNPYNGLARWLRGQMCAIPNVLELELIDINQPLT